VDLAGGPVQGDERVGVEVRPWVARAVGELRRAGIGRRVGNTHEDTSAAVDRRWVPEAAAGVDLRVAEELVAALDRVELPDRLAALGVQRVDDPEGARVVEVRR